MKKFFIFTVLFVTFFVTFTTLDLSGNEKTAKVAASVKADNAPDDSTTKKAICDLFENNGVKVKRAMYQPLIERDPGLYGGQERWTITLEDGEQITAFVTNGTITFCYGGVEYDYLPLY